MNRIRWVVTAVGLVLAALPAVGQAYQVQQDGGVAKEQNQSVLAIPAEDQATRDQLMKLFEEMHIRQQMDSLTKTVPAMVEQQVREQMKSISSGKQMSAREQEALTQFEKRIMEKAMSIYPLDEMLSDMADVYQKHITKEDADSLIAIYGSPAVQHLLAAQPTVMQEFMPVVMKRIGDRSKELNAEIVKEAAEMQKEFGTAPKSTATPK